MNLRYLLATLSVVTTDVPHKLRALLLVSAFLSGACGRREAVPSTAASSVSTAAAAGMPSTRPVLPKFPRPERPKVEPAAQEKIRAHQELLLRTYPAAVASWEQEARMREDMVSPAPPGFQPEFQGLMLRVVLTAKSNMLRRSESFWYKLELQNIGTETIHITDEFLRDGGIRYPSNIEFHVIEPNSTSKKIPIGYLPWERDEPPPPDVEMEPLKIPGMDKAKTDEEKAIALERWKAQYRIDLRLLPGETLRSKPWKYVSYSESERNLRAGLPEELPVPGQFRELWTSYRFDKPGTYRVRVVYRDEAGEPIAEEDIRYLERRGHSREEILHRDEAARRSHLGLVSSNSVLLEVVP